MIVETPQVTAKVREFIYCSTCTFSFFLSALFCFCRQSSVLVRYLQKLQTSLWNYWSLKSTWTGREAAIEAHKKSDGRFRCRQRHYREHAVGRNSADISVLHSAPQRRELRPQIPMRQVPGIWHVLLLIYMNTNCPSLPVQVHICIFSVHMRARRWKRKSKEDFLPVLYAHTPYHPFDFCSRSQSSQNHSVFCIMSHQELQIFRQIFILWC